MASESGAFGKIATGLMYAYVIGIVLAMPYYNWIYARDHGFLKWVFFGEIVATVKAVIWPVWFFW